MCLQRKIVKYPWKGGNNAIMIIFMMNKLNCGTTFPLIVDLRVDRVYDADEIKYVNKINNKKIINNLVNKLNHT